MGDKTKKRRKKYQGMDVEFSKVIVFPQIRQTFDYLELRLLANDIAENGLVQPSILARLSPDKFSDYRKAFEEISGHRIEGEFPFTVEDNEMWYYVLIAGERRYRAHAILWHEGCDDCQKEAREENRTLLPGECYRKHMDGNEMEIRACTNIDPMDAKSIQFRENNYIKPPLHEEAYAYQQYYRFMKHRDGKVTITAFAKAVGVSVEKVRRALWFCELPERVQTAVRENHISYSHALEMKRLLDIHKEEEREVIARRELDWLFMRPKFKLEDYRKRISNIIEESTTQLLFSIEEFVITPKQKRRVVEESILPMLGLNSRYIEKVLKLLQEGQLGENKLYSGHSPDFQIKRIVISLHKLMPEIFGLSEEQTDMLKHVNLDKPKHKERA